MFRMGLGAVQPANLGQLYGIDCTYLTIRSTHPSDIKGRCNQEGFYFSFGKWGR
jgi:hypothetical protein